MISIIVPSYGRPERVAPLLANIHETTKVPYEVYFVVEIGQWVSYFDTASFNQSMNVKLIANERSRNYAGAVNTAVKYAQGDTLFIGADDVTFHLAWDVQALIVMAALPHIKVVGTNDLLNAYVLQGTHATHYLVDRDYAFDPGGVVDGEPGHLLFEGYDHNYTDTEFIGTAKARAVFAPCLTSIVEHNHFTAGKSEKDETYDKAYAHIDDDARLYLARQPLWWGISK